MCKNMFTSMNKFLQVAHGWRRPFYTVPFMENLEFDVSVNPGKPGLVGPPNMVFSYQGGIHNCVPTNENITKSDAYRFCDRSDYSGSELHDLPTRTNLSTSEF